MFYLLRSSHEVDSSVISVIFLKQAEGELVIDQQVIWLRVREREKNRNTDKKQPEQTCPVI